MVDDKPNDGMESPEIVSLKIEMIGFVQEGLKEGQTFEQIEEKLIEEKFPKKVIDFCIKYVKEKNGISLTDEQKLSHISKKSLEPTNTKEKQESNKKEEPTKNSPINGTTILFGIVILTITIFVGYFMYNTVIGQVVEKSSTPQKIDVDLYLSLGIDPNSQKITDETTILSKEEIVNIGKTDSLLRKNKGNQILNKLKSTDAITGYKKEIKTYVVSTGQQKNLVRIRFQANRDVEKLRLIEDIPKESIYLEDIKLTTGGTIVEKDPIIMFSYNNVKQGDVITAIYAVTDIEHFKSNTHFAEQITETEIEQGICGDGRCQYGESHINCCEDCGCLPNFECRSNTCQKPFEGECRRDNECNDNDPKTEDKCVRNACINTNLCVNDDGICHEVCNSYNDLDCDQTIIESNVNGDTDGDGVEALDITGDQVSPRIRELHITPENVALGSEVLIEAIVVDANGKDDIASVWYEVLELAETHDEKGNMNDLGLDGDKTKNDDTYSIKLFIGPNYQKKWYHVTVYAQDRSGNRKKMQKQFKVSEEGEVTITSCSDMDCFIGYTRDCEKAEYKHTVGLVTEDDIEITTTYNLEIKGIENEKCKFYLQVEEITVKYLQSHVDTLLSEGFSQSNIDIAEETDNTDADEYEGETGFCYHETTDLVGILERWKNIDNAYDELVQGECEGIYFSG